MKRRLLIYFILLAAIIPQCEKDDPLDCTNAICSTELMHIGIQIYHKSDSTAFLLTDYKVIRVSGKRDITIVDNNLSDNKGYYPITNDNKMEIFQNKDIELEFKGYLNDALVIIKRFIISADCCHIFLVKGHTIFYI